MKLRLLLVFCALWGLPAPAQEGARLASQEPIILDQTMAIVNDQVLTISDVQREAARAAESMGEAPDDMDVFYRTAQSMILEMLFREGFRLTGIDEGVLDRITQDEIQRRIDTVGSPAAFAAELEQQGTTPELEFQQTKQALIGLYFRQAEFGQAPKLGSKSYSNYLYAAPSEIRAYFDANPAEFLQPRMVNARILLALNSRHEDPRLFMQKLRGQVENGLDFSEAAAQHSAFAPNSRNLTGLSDPNTLGFKGEVQDFLLSAADDEISIPLETPSGWALVHAFQVQEERVLSLGEVQSQIEQKILMRKRQDVLTESVNRIRRRCYLWLTSPAEQLLNQAFGPLPEDEEEL